MPLRGLDHGQLSWAPKHIIIGEKVTLIDFERASTKRQAKNLSALFGYLIVNPKSESARKIREALGVSERERKKIITIKTTTEFDSSSLYIIIKKQAQKDVIIVFVKM